MKENKPEYKIYFEIKHLWLKIKAKNSSAHMVPLGGYVNKVHQKKFLICATKHKEIKITVYITSKDNTNRLINSFSGISKTLLRLIDILVTLENKRLFHCSWKETQITLFTFGSNYQQVSNCTRSFSPLSCPTGLFHLGPFFPGLIHHSPSPLGLFPTRSFPH